MFEDCQAVSNVRVEVGIAEFMRQAKAAGRSTDTAYRLYLSGKDPEEESVTAGEWLERGVALQTLQSKWLEG